MSYDSWGAYYKSIQRGCYINDLFDNVIAWAEARNLIKDATPHAQMLKLAEEMGELAKGIARNKPADIQDGIGDMVVVLTILAKQYGLSIELCLGSAYNEIKDRKGQLRDGVFVKEGD